MSSDCDSRSDRHGYSRVNRREEDQSFQDSFSDSWRCYKNNQDGFFIGKHYEEMHQDSFEQVSSKFHDLDEQKRIDQSRQEQEDFLKDFFESLMVKGYPVVRFLDQIANLFTNYEPVYRQLMNRLVGKLPRIKQQLRQVFSSLPIDTDLNQIQQLVHELLPNLSQGTRKQLIQQNLWIFQNQPQICLKFKQHGYNIITDRNKQGNLNLMMLVTESMREMYWRYGDCLSIDFIDKVIKKKSPYGFSDYSSWFFTGHDYNLANVLFGFAIINQQDDTNVTLMLKHFLSEMDNIPPISVCIPPYTILQHELQELLPSAVITINWYHKLKLLKQSLQTESSEARPQSQIQEQSIMKSICKCFRTDSQQEFDMEMQKIMSKISCQSLVVYGVHQGKENYCVLGMPLRYIGFGIEMDKFLDLEKSARQVFVYQRNVARLFIQVIKLQKRLNTKAIVLQKDNKYIEQKNSNQIVQSNNQQCLDRSQTFEIPSDQSHYAIGMKPSRKVRERIEYSVQQLGKYQLHTINPVTIQLITGSTGRDKPKKYTLTFNLRHNHWQCNCRFIYHTGVPCAHLIKTVEKFGGDYLYYLCPRWVGEGQQP